MLLVTLFPSLHLSFHEVQLRVTTNQGHSTETPSRTWLPQSTEAGLGKNGARPGSGQKQLRHRTFLSPAVLIGAGQRAHFPCA